MTIRRRLYTFLQRISELLQTQEGRKADAQGVVKRELLVEEKYKFLFNNVNDAIFFHEMNGNFVEVNDVACRRLGYTREELLQMAVKDIDIPEMISPELFKNFSELGYAVGEVGHLSKDGTKIPVELSIRLIRSGGNQMVLTIARDISERKLAEENEKLYREQLEKLVLETKEMSTRLAVSNEIIRAINASLDYRETLQAFMTELRKIVEFDTMKVCLFETERNLVKYCLKLEPSNTFKFTEKEILDYESEGNNQLNALKCGFVADQAKLNEYWHESDQETLSAIVLPLIYQGENEGIITIESRKPGLYGEKELNLLPLLVENLGVALKNARLHAKVEEAAIMIERNRIAQEMHDSTLQTLGYFRVKGEFLETMIKRRMYSECLKVSREIQQVALEAFNDTREAVHALATGTKYGQSLCEMIRVYLDKISERWCIKTELSVPDEIPRLEYKAELHLIRIIQEALTNVRKHSGAMHVWVKFYLRDSGFAVDIRDDGCGFNTFDSSGTSFGLKIMRERAESIGGQLRIESTRGEGTLVMVWLPIK